MAWVSVTLDVPLKVSDHVQALLTDCGAAGLEVRDGEVKMPNVRQPRGGEAIIIGFFDKKPAAKRAMDKALATWPKAKGLLEAVVEKDWSVEWRNQIRCVEVGRLWVGPPWEKPPKDKVVLVIEPKMAFGTGDHPTTSLCLAAVDDFMKANPKATVLDVGTGTGVLVFAAKKLGAGRCVGTDNDPIAIELAEENALANDVKGVDLSTKNLDKVKGEFDLVLANILANTLVALAPLIAPKVKKRLVLAGVLVPQRAEVEAAFVAQGLKATGHEVQGEWIRLDFEAAASRAAAR